MISLDMPISSAGAAQFVAEALEESRRVFLSYPPKGYADGSGRRILLSAPYPSHRDQPIA